MKPNRVKVDGGYQKQRSVRRCMCGIYEREMKRGVDEEIAESD
jgi:hypothetical protein